MLVPSPLDGQSYAALSNLVESEKMGASREVWDCCLDDTSGAFAPLCLTLTDSKPSITRGSQQVPLIHSEAGLGKELSPKNYHR